LLEFWVTKERAVEKDSQAFIENMQKMSLLANTSAQHQLLLEAISQEEV
jgi:hypothetical protein